ncbi:metallophosphoesterase [Methylocapsa acidiphila]|uniref:metallophosphoesterase n=1 Tax=Methylocapsa acidiphila TaxID=133552 RepID=UPI000401FE43|nr:metallophosphoesterase [Methylocapsa acidiphila]
MTDLSRRLFLQGAGGFALATAGFGSYAFALEPGLSLQITSYRLTPPNWPEGLTVRAAILSDIHACEPWTPAARVRSIAEAANALSPDIIFILGDFNGSQRHLVRPVTPPEWGEALSVLDAPLGVYSILGNHDWWHGALPGMPSDDAAGIRQALAAARIRLLENDVVRISKGGRHFWVAGLGDQLAGVFGRHMGEGADDLPGTLAQITDRGPVILLAHEPYIFRRVPDRVSLTLSGHTHGGQINLPFLGTPLSLRRFGATFTDLVYGHIVQNGRHLIISGGLGTSHIPVRFMRPPEIVELTLGGSPIASGLQARANAPGQS